MKYSMIIVDDHKIVRDGLKACFIGRMDLDIIDEAGSGNEGEEKICRLKPDLVFMDIRLPDINGAELAVKLKYALPSTRFALLTSEPNSNDLNKAKAGGVEAFLTKDMDTTEYFNALDQLIKGKKYISQAFAQLLMHDPIELTPKEMEILEAFAKGLSYKEIAAQLTISTRTVETHKLNILEKFGTRSIVEMVRKAIQLGILKN